MQRNIGIEDGQDGHAAQEIARQLAMLPTILAMIEEVRQLLAGQLKSHYTVEEVAELTGRAPYTVRTWIKQGRIAAARVAGTGPKGRLLVARDELRKLVDSGLGGRTPEVPVRSDDRRAREGGHAHATPHA